MIKTAKSGSALRRLLTIDEAAAYLCVSKRSFYKLVEAGEVRKVPIGARRFIDVQDLDDYVERIKAESA